MTYSYTDQAADIDQILLENGCDKQTIENVNRFILTDLPILKLVSQELLVPGNGAVNWKWICSKLEWINNDDLWLAINRLVESEHIIMHHDLYIYNESKSLSTLENT